jgi:hypothetical protein
MDFNVEGLEELNQSLRQHDKVKDDSTTIRQDSLEFVVDC